MEFKNFPLINKFHKNNEIIAEKKLDEINMSDLKVKKKKYLMFASYVTKKEFNQKADEIPIISIERHLGNKDV